MKGHIRYFFCNLVSSIQLINQTKNSMHNFKFDVPKLERQEPKLLQMTPIQAVGQLYKVNEINQMTSSSFHVQTKK
jgi:hypothetical protein